MKELTAEQKWIDEQITIAVGDVLVRILPKLEPSPPNAAAVIEALQRIAASCAIRFNVGRDDFMKLALEGFEEARKDTREVDAEEDN